MNQDNKQIDQLQEAERVVVVLGSSRLAKASGLALVEGLRSVGKKSLILDDAHRVEHFNLPAIEQVIQNLPVESMTLQWPWRGEEVDTIQTEIDKEKKQVNLIVENPKEGTFPKPEEIQIGYNQWIPDLWVKVGKGINGNLAKNNGLDTIDKLEWKEEELLDNLIFLSQTQDWTLSKPLATNLLIAIDTETDNLQRTDLKPEIFELVADCIRAGGERLALGNIQERDKQAQNSEEATHLNDNSDKKSKDQASPQTLKDNEDQQASHQEKENKKEKMAGQKSEPRDEKKSSYVIPDWLKTGVN